MLLNQKWNSEPEKYEWRLSSEINSQIDLGKSSSDKLTVFIKLREKKRIKYFKKNYLKLDLNKVIGNNNGKWTEREKIIFIKEFIENGNEWNRLEDCIKTRNRGQIRSHAQKFFERLSKLFSDQQTKVIITPDSFCKFIWPLAQEKKESIKKMLINLFHSDSNTFNISTSLSTNNNNLYFKTIIENNNNQIVIIINFF
jgi:hypothetical protein